MKILKNIEAFETDYKRFYKGDLEYLDFGEVIKEVKSDDGDYELSYFESNVGHGKTFFFEESIVLENDEEITIATYTGHGNH